MLHQGVQALLFALSAAGNGGVQAFAQLVSALLRGADLSLRVLLL